MKEDTMKTWNAFRKTGLVICVWLVAMGLFLPSALAQQTPQQMYDQANAAAQEASDLLTQSQNPDLTDAQRNALLQQALAKADLAYTLAQQALSAIKAAADAAESSGNTAQAQAMYNLAAQVDGIFTRVIDIGNTISAIASDQNLINNATTLVSNASAAQGQISGIMQRLIALGAVPPTTTPAGFSPPGEGGGGAQPLSPIGPPSGLGQGGIASPT